MNNAYYSKIALLVLGLILLVSCHGLEELNENPNQIGSENVDPNLLLPTVINGAGKAVVGLGFGDIAGVMQHTQKDGWSSGHNAYDWSNDSHSWNSYYTLLTNNKNMIEKAEADNLEFHRGAGLVMKSFLFGLITDLWGDAPYSAALRGNEGAEFFDAVFDDQRSIYEGILLDLETANSLLSKDQGSYFSIQANQDILFGGDVAKWRKFANSLALRYYMRLSVKEPAWAEQGIRKLLSNPQLYPLIIDAADDANMAYVGNTSVDSWPTNTKFDADSQGAYFRIKMGATLVNELQELNDPRLGVWANKIDIPLVLDAGAPDGTDEVIDGERHVAQDIVDAYEDIVGFPVDYDKEYVGLPVAMTFGIAYNLSENLNQGALNLHVSQLNDIYKEANGDLLQARLISAAEVNFIKAEAATKGWVSGGAEGYYNEAIKQSLNAWGVGDAYSTYIAGPAAYTGPEDILMQKWIASWSAAAESWFDYRRTGIPNLQAGAASKRQALPLRFYYHIDEIDNNKENADAAIGKLETTDFKGDDATNNSAWSKMWLLQGTNKPY
ncbi:SusD/RagB family nutrient-binding outer membrane lipoprotein [Aurantibacter crassamenti]|uniref:SusD/RagB family nutrient-binding outer membrane lipoprotein n=1 Tax=Aurantibacter crassamenti TaxID=1837375 RepID=UPI00193A3CA6|nr:SusD/RagB family nutrient-binding outer membrane lipoprotein [Aurantibacter crassamenti]MBM1105118.1 SusD/RagB family nutrient-binding outer membrane lipoprotein [Aurantibacter crassamenti]